MPNYRLDSRDRLDIDLNRQRIAERSNQPVSAPLGNYRLDDQARPILPPESPFDPDNLELDEDYFVASRNQSFEDSRMENGNSSRLTLAYSRSENPNNTHHSYYSSQNYEDYDAYYHPSRSSNYRADYAQEYYRWDIEQEQAAQARGWLSLLGHQFSSLHTRVKNRYPYNRPTLPRGRWKLLIVFSMIYAAMLWSGWQILPFNKVNHLVVNGNYYLPDSVILEGVNTSPYQQADQFLSYRSEIEKYVKEKHPIIEDLLIKREDWRQIVFDVKERPIVGRLELDHLQFPMFSNGEILEASEGLAQQMTEVQWNNIPIIAGGFGDRPRQNLAIALSQVDPAILKEIDRIEPSQDPLKQDHIQVYMKDGNQVKAVIATFAQKVNYYPKFIKQLDGRKGIIDIEVGAYFTPMRENVNSVKLENN